MNSEAYEEMKRLQNSHWWFLARRQIIETALERLPLQKVSKVMEVGCGVGGNVEMLSARGSLLGIDFHEPAVKYCQSAYPEATFVHADILDLDIASFGTFNSIFMLDVLEHLSEEELVLEKLKAILDEEGHLVITVPAYNFLWSKHDEFVHHKRRYTKKRVVALLSNSGYTVDYATYFNSILLPLAIVQRVSYRVFNRISDGHLSVPCGPINFFLKNVFAIEKQILRYLDFKCGLSILVIASKAEESVK